MSQTIAYNLDSLGWLQFENLVQELLSAELGLGVEAWGGSADHGKDAYCESELNFPNRHVVKPGPFVFQAKFVAGANAAGAAFLGPLYKSVANEVALISTRIRSKKWCQPQAFGFFTNAPMTANTRGAIRRRLCVVMPKADIAILGAHDICNLLDTNVSVARAFPQVLSLRNLTELLERVVRNGALQRSAAVIREAQALTSVFVPTSAYQQAWNILAKHNFVVLEGPPEMGKTAIAWMIAAVKLTEKWEAVDCDDPKDFFDAYAPGRSQVFIADDAFGTTEYETARGGVWGRQMHKILPMLDRRHWLVWTTRTHILQIALQEMGLQVPAARFPAPAEVLVSAGKLTIDERALILYRHARSANLEETGKFTVRKNAVAIIENPHFTPERIRRFVSEGLREISARPGLPEIEQIEAIRAAIDHPTDRMQRAFSKLDDSQKWLLIALLDCGRMPTKGEVEESFRRFCEVRRPVAEEIEILDGTFVEQTGRGIEWIHPSYRDLVIQELERDESRGALFLESCSLTGLELSISVAGGAKGERRFPLMTGPRSWATVRKRLVDLIRNADSQIDLYSILRAVRTAMQSSQEVTDVQPYLADIINTCCVEAKSRIDTLNKPIFGFVLDEFLQSTMTLVPPPPMPNMSLTLRAADDRYQEAVADAPGKRPDEVAIKEWARIVGVISRSDQRVLRQAGFPENFQRKIENLCSLILHESSGSPIFSEPDIYHSESQRMNNLAAALADLDGVVPQIQDQIDEAWNAANDSADELRREHESLMQDGGSDATTSFQKRQSVDVARLFSDL